MNAAEREFWPIFNAVCDDANLSMPSRKVAWDSCHIEDKNGKEYLDPYARDMYLMLSRTKPPYLDCG